MLQMLYVSGASSQMSDTDIEDILTASRRNNLRNCVTGMLLWADGVFIQVLEGEPDTVRSLYRRIQADDRHRNLMLVLEQAAGKRLFSRWSMGFKQLDANRAADRKLFQISRHTLAERITNDDSGMLLDTVVAFSRDFIADTQRPVRAISA
ncbi:FAD-dependent sensor of blue light [Hoeflea halophila]|uniref:FAD-dependent sensor of blue light n=2 Tax=Hoeflea halophila TaxID=714899 RepID=A0A286IEI9_9HYPH|nr:FAD-dependent sensor of blue light [Hoeflea halophila]